MRSHPGTALSDPGGLIGPPWPLMPAPGSQDPQPAETIELIPADLDDADPHPEAGDG